MQSWQIGDVHIHRVRELEVKAPYESGSPFIDGAKPECLREVPWLYPDYVTENDELLVSIHALLVEAPGFRLVVDTCIGNDKPRRMTGFQGLQTRFLERFGETGWARESVDAVVCTHLHVDHVGWNTMLKEDAWVPTFPNARYLLGRREYEYWSQSDSEDQAPVMADSVKPIFDRGLVDLVEMDHVLHPNIRLRPTPGHTPGHVSVVIESNGESGLITGDFIHHPCQMARPEWSVRFDEDKAAARAMRRELLEELADSPVLVIGTHFAMPTAGRVVRDGESFRFTS